MSKRSAERTMNTILTGILASIRPRATRDFPPTEHELNVSRAQARKIARRRSKNRTARASRARNRRR